ncbi:MAG: DUF2726 domain-containing protein [Candidatus Moraniibacteriota bacterium]
MNIFLMIAILIIAAAGVLHLLKDRIYTLINRKSEKYSPYKKREFLMNIPERKFFKKLNKIKTDDYEIFPQVLLSNIVEVSISGKQALAWWNKINRKTIDFVFFVKPYYKPVLAIEYDGKTHNSFTRKKRDDEVGKILKSSGIGIIHIKHNKNIDYKELKQEIHKGLEVEKNF